MFTSFISNISSYFSNKGFIHFLEKRTKITYKYSKISMNSKFEELESFREDISVLKAAVGLLRDWIADKFGVQVFDEALLHKSRLPDDANTRSENPEPLRLKTICNRTLLPKIPIAIAIATTKPSYHFPDSRNWTENEIPSHDAATHQIHIIRPVNSLNANITEVRPASLENQTRDDYYSHGGDSPDDNSFTDQGHSSQLGQAASASTSQAIGKMTGNSTLWPRIVDPDLSSSSSAFPIDKASKSRAVKKKLRKTKSKKSPSSTKIAKVPEDLSQIQCEICGKLLNGSSAMKRHMQTHKNARSHVCTDCGKSFQRSFHLKTHRMIHSGEKKHQCRFCGRLFLLPKDLTCHERTHTGEKPFGCSLCSRSFNLKSHLTMHFRTHTGEKPYKCDMCDKCFSQSNSLRVHKKIHQKIQDPDPEHCHNSEMSGHANFPFQLNQPSSDPNSNTFVEIANATESEDFRLQNRSEPQDIVIPSDEHHSQEAPIITIIESMPNNINFSEGEFSNFDTHSNAMQMFVFQQQ